MIQIGGHYCHGECGFFDYLNYGIGLSYLIIMIVAYLFFIGVAVYWFLKDRRKKNEIKSRLSG